jgi:hypothetical protein
MLEAIFSRGIEILEKSLKLDRKIQKVTTGYVCLNSTPSKLSKE